MTPPNPPAGARRRAIVRTSGSASRYGSPGASRTDSIAM